MNEEDAPGGDYGRWSPWRERVPPNRRINGRTLVSGELNLYKEDAPIGMHVGVLG